MLVPAAVATELAKGTRGEAGRLSLSDPVSDRWRHVVVRGGCATQA
jgi:hypothetical protein